MSLRLREDNARDLIAASGYFDVDWYLRRYPDVAASGFDPIVHYLRHGAAEGRVHRRASIPGPTSLAIPTCRHPA